MDSISTAYGDVEMPAAEPAPAQEPVSQQQQAPEVPWWEQHKDSELEFQASGKQVKAPLSQVRQWAQQGYHYAQNMQAVNAEKASIEARSKELAADAEIAEVVKFARENPEWAQYARQAYEERQTWAQQNADNPLVRDFQTLRQEIEPIKAEALALKQERERIQAQKEDEALNAEIKGISEKYSKRGMDLSQIDPQTGMSFEATVLAHANEHGLRSFKAAFYELYGDKLESLTEEAVKKQVAAENAKLAKEGFIGRTPTPTQGPAKARNIREMSYSQLAEEGLAEYRAGKR